MHTGLLPWAKILELTVYFAPATEISGRTKLVAYADDRLLTTRQDSIIAVEI